MAKFVAYSGASPADITLVNPQVGGDALTGYRRSASDVTLMRNGAPISVRNWKTLRRWNFNYNAIASAGVTDLYDYFQARVFKYQPTGSALVEYTVRWVETEFRPAQIKPGYFSLSFTIEEVVT